MYVVLDLCFCRHSWSLFDLLDFAPIDAFFQHDLGSLDSGKSLKDAKADPEEHNHEDDAKQGVGVDPQADIRVCVVNALGLNVSEEEGHHGCNRG